MIPRAFYLILGFAWVARSAMADEAPPPKTASIGREAIKDFKFQPQAVSVEERTPVLKSALPSDAPVVMSPYTVRALPDRTLQDLTDAFSQKERLKPPALLHVGDRIDILLPPKIEMSPAGEPRLNLGIINLRW